MTADPAPAVQRLLTTVRQRLAPFLNDALDDALDEGSDEGLSKGPSQLADSRTDSPKQGPSESPKSPNEDSQQRLLVGFSGGLDSHVLLHLLCRLGYQSRLAALHVNHGISQHAPVWQRHCHAVCNGLGIECETITVVLPGTGNLEDNARRARYAAFESRLSKNDVLLLGHHQDDQVETALFHLLRGSGHYGLKAMPASRALGAALLVRPLLEIPHADLLAYARLHGLGWIEDDSNSDIRLSRNYLRHQVVPVLQTHWPDVRQTIAAALARNTEQDQLLEALADEDLRRLADDYGGIELAGLAALELPRQKNLLTRWIQRQGLSFPSSATLDAALPGFIGAQSPKVSLDWPGGCLRRNNKGVYLLQTMPPVQSTLNLTVSPQSNAEPVAWQGGSLTLLDANSRGLLRPGRYSVRVRQGGEVLRRDHGVSIKQWLQSQRVPAWLRERLPLLYDGDELVAVAGLPNWRVPPLIATGYACQKGAEGWRPGYTIKDIHTVRKAHPHPGQR